MNGLKLQREKERIYYRGFIKQSKLIFFYFEINLKKKSKSFLIKLGLFTKEKKLDTKMEIFKSLNSSLS